MGLIDYLFKTVILWQVKQKMENDEEFQIWLKQHRERIQQLDREIKELEEYQKSRGL